jgi:hypothetical protein
MNEETIRYTDHNDFWLPKEAAVRIREIGVYQCTRFYLLISGFNPKLSCPSTSFAL